MPDTLKILFLIAEAEPFVKVGGLADVGGSLPLALRLLEGNPPLDVRLALPLHRTLQLDPARLAPRPGFSLSPRGVEMPVRVLESQLAGMPVYFIDGEPVAQAENVYSRDPAGDREKYTFFSLAALEMTRHLGWMPDILHTNDWHTALALYALHAWRGDPFFARMRSLLTLHNLPYMGGDASGQLAAYGLPPLVDENLPSWARGQPLPLGLWAADRIVAVSPTYAREVLTPGFGCGLQDFLRLRGAAFSAILNGLDVQKWNPATDDALAACFDLTRLETRRLNTRHLRQHLGLPDEPEIPLLAMVGRIDAQKGVDILLDALRRIADLPWQFVILGRGDPSLEHDARRLEADFPSRIRAVIDFNAPLGHLVYAAADMFLMPSRYEPCGLAQMIAMHYGAVPLVRATGGLKDTVTPGQTGFLFETATPVNLAETLRWALSMYSNAEEWLNLQRNGMTRDFSWTKSAQEYRAVYQSLLA